ncbi:MAG: hypothetical protein IT354_17140, partial [Gemmatimonadaceae bacterium]|nr:hypothetical protein [Gemmatimonadaceae bacterium]
MNVFTVFAQELAGALDPLRIGIEDSSALARVLETVGTRPDAVGAAGLLPALTAARDAIAAVAAMDSAPATLASVRTTLAAVRTTLDALRVARTAEATPFVDLGRDVLAVLAARHVRLRASRAYHVAVALGLINHRSIPGAEGARWPADVVQFDTGQLAALVTTPVAALRSLLPSDLLATRASANETSDRVVTRSAGLLRSLALPWRYGVRADDAEWVGAMLPHVEHMLLVKLPYKLVGDDEIGVCLSLSPADEDDLGVVVKPFGGLVLERQLLDWVVSIALNADVQAFAFGGGQGFQLLATPSTTEVRATFLAARATDAPLVIGGSSGTRLELDGLRFHGEANLSAALRTIDLGFEVERGLFVVTSDGGDGFLRRVVGTRELRVPFDFGVSYTTGRGLRFKGGAGFAVRLPGGVSVGPLTVGEVSIALEVSAEALRLVASASVRLALGPVDVRIEDVGTQLVAVFPAESLARDFDVDFDVQPPDGAAFAIDAGPVRGGGYLRHAAGRYAGALALDALGISLSAFGLLDAT